MKLALLYSRDMRNAGCCTGVIEVVDDAGSVDKNLASFSEVTFTEMLHLYATWVKRYPEHKCVFRRLDKVGFPLMEWAPTDIERLRTDTDKAVEDLAQIRNVTYDMRPDTKEKS